MAYLFAVTINDRSCGPPNLCMLLAMLLAILSLDFNLFLVELMLPLLRLRPPEEPIVGFKVVDSLDNRRVEAYS